jgi:tetratricopeptide (TPR) repeat protein/TolB-like protein
MCPYGLTCIWSNFDTMSTHPNKLSQFWKELKRRRVVKTFAMYGATAFILMEAADIMLPRLGLPDWTVTFIIVLLIAGFPISLVLSWIFDITPEGFKKTESTEELQESESSSSPGRKSNTLGNVIIVVLVIAVGVLLYPKLFPSDRYKELRDEEGRISIAVLPFENQTGDTTLNWFGKGISSLMTNGLGSSHELAVYDDQSLFEMMEGMDLVNTAGISRTQAREIAGKARAESYISGSYQGRDGKYWILANLVNTESGDIILTRKVEGDLTSADYLELANSLCQEIRDHLEIQAMEQRTDFDFREAYTASAEAYRHYVEGMNSMLSRDYLTAVQYFGKALEIDSTFTFASFNTAMAYCFVFPQQMDQSKLWTKRTNLIREHLPLKYQQWVELWHACYFEKDQQKIIRLLASLEASGIEWRLFWYDLAVTHHDFSGQYDKAIQAYERIEAINQERSDDWEFEDYYFRYGRELHQSGNHQKENEIYKLSLELFPNDLNNREMYWGLSVCALSRGDSLAAKSYLDNFVAAKKRLGESEENIQFHLANIDRIANLTERAEAQFRKLIEQYPQSNNYKYVLGKLLIEEDLDVNEGVELIDMVLARFPDDVIVNEVKGWGYFKLGRYEEALTQLKRAEDLDKGFRLPRSEKIRQVEQALASQ